MLVIVEAETVRDTHLCLCHRTCAFVFLREEEPDGHEELVDADPKLFLILAACGQREEPAGLDNVLEDVLAGLETEKEQLSFIICVR